MTVVNEELLATSEYFASEERRTQVETFFQEHSAPAAERTIRQSLERIRLNATWLERNRSELAEWFD